MKKVKQLAMFVSVSSLFLVAPTTTASQVAQPTTQTAEHARVFITDSQSWEMSGGGGGSSSGFGGATHGGARPQRQRS